MDLTFAPIGWALFILFMEFVTWRIFYRKTVRICFLTEPDLPFSRYFTIGFMRALTIMHACILIGIVFYFHVIL
ncbi:hypothetical protein COU76_02255 [Candidatus Peregrinibacteria bacterium CG10_big_fil_rev_8_21_14_0_10_49_10]|nr:MAG: hypothetical protein COU76_02255 [Candidatus Peregrinibacteria bacterium CG10_big_fil_rev_8_21_14_0_10_49_10]